MQRVDAPVGLLVIARRADVVVDQAVGLLAEEVELLKRMIDE